ncbi:hypothetical protein EOS_09225 [Caballeronia mineralivorans PML1(12)]|uniref:Uncharacterized protein n=1 Tax=Caballeronia mineralivorans PML1(12) TaxID=908627 RepID=A0A0J1D172_9BURK|nr:hypothetical protein [Caballeronia mineralivorans]KLU26507.1 hypothetical protein EOS_09225 [Caballeronia mineralivorans PML1(12)]
MASDPYQEAKAIADSLDKVGLREHADQVRGALVEGATGTEIYMILRWRLANLAQDLAIPADLKARAILLHDYLDRALGP